MHYFVDGVEADGGRAIRLEHADAERKVKIELHVALKCVENADGSVGSMGPLTKLEKYSQAEFEACTFAEPRAGDRGLCLSGNCAGCGGTLGVVASLHPLWVELQSESNYR